MSDSDGPALIAVDVGNSRMKFGLLKRPSPPDQMRPTGAMNLPEFEKTLDLTPGEGEFGRIKTWLAGRSFENCQWWIGSVQRQYASLLVDFLRQSGTRRMTLLSAGDLPLSVNVPRPDMVGIDRLLAAVAGNALRGKQRPAIVVDAGTAITVDLISSAGAFEGGAILPGLNLGAKALHHFTDLLPLIEANELADPPDPVGKSTTAAMRSGLFWGAVGGVRELVTRMMQGLSASPDIFLTGGAAKNVAPLLGPSCRHVENLTIAGIVLTARHLSSQSEPCGSS